jgi:acetoin utilization protein AcuB
MSTMREPIAGKDKCSNLILDERGEASLAHAVVLALMVSAVVVATSLLGISQPRFSSLEGIRLWIQVSAIVAGFGLFYFLTLRRSRYEQGTSEPPDGRMPSQAEVRASLYAKRQEIHFAICKDPEALANGQIIIRHLMTTRLITVAPQAMVDEARRTMIENHLRHLLVCDNDKLLGIVSDRDFSKVGRIVADIMTRKPVTVEPKTPIQAAIPMMMQKRISCLPVVEGDRLVGLFTTTDLILTLQCAFQLLQTTNEQLTVAMPASPSVRPEIPKRNALASKT